MRTLPTIAAMSIAAACLAHAGAAHAIPLPDSSSCSTSSDSGCLKITNTNNNGIGIYGDGKVIGVRGFSAMGMGLQGVSTGYIGIYGSSTANAGVAGYSSSNYGVWGTTSAADMAGVRGSSDDSDGVQGESESSAHSGVAGFNWVAGGIGVFGVTNSSGGGSAIYGEAGNSSTAWAGYFAGRVRATQYVTASDRRLKSHVRNIPYGLREIARLRPVSYKWRTGTPDQQEQLGLIAQEVQGTIPELVDTDDKSGMMSVNYQALSPVIVKALQEQQAMIRSQQATIKKQENRLAAIEQAGSPALSSNMSALALGLLPLGLVAVRRRLVGKPA